MWRNLELTAMERQSRYARYNIFGTLSGREDRSVPMKKFCGRCAQEKSQRAYANENKNGVKFPNAW